MSSSVCVWRYVVCCGVLCTALLGASAVSAQTSGTSTNPTSTSATSGGAAKAPQTERSEEGKKRDAKAQEALLLARRKKIDEAIKILEEIVKAEPDHKQGVIELARNYMIQRRPKDSEAVLIKGIETSPDIDSFHYYLSVHYRNTGDPKKAMDALEKGLKANPKSDTLYVLKGQTWSDRDIKIAEEAYKKALEIDPIHRTALNNLAVIYIEDNRFKDAREVLEVYVKNIKRGASGRFNLGLVYGKLGEYDKAEELYKTLLKARPTDQFSLSGLALVHTLRGEYAKAKEVFGTPKEGAKIPPLVAYARALIALFENRLEDAEKFGEIAGGKGKASVYTVLVKAETARRKKALKIADEILSAQLKRKPNEAMTKAYLALVRFDQGRLEDAKKLLKESIAAHADYTKVEDLRSFLRWDDTALNTAKKILAETQASEKSGQSTPELQGKESTPKASSGCGCVQLPSAPVRPLGASVLVLLGALVWLRRRS